MNTNFYTGLHMETFINRQWRQGRHKLYCV